MKTGILFFIFCFNSIIGLTQTSGEVIADGRKITEDIDYTMTMSEPGVLVFNIAVNTEGKVTSCEWNKMESTTNERKARYMAKNLILTHLKFEAGNGFPTFHQGKVTITATTP